MANPVFDRLESQWQQSTPAGYPTMPGYQPGQSSTSPTDARFPYGAAAGAQAAEAARQTPTYDQRAMEQSYQAPSADAVDRGRMTYDDVIVKTGLLFGILVIAAAGSWMLTMANPATGALLMGAGFLIGFVLAMVNIFSKTIRPALIMAYALAQGLALGGLSAMMEAYYPGIVIQALIATISVFGVTLALFASGKVRNSPKIMRFALIGLIAILVYRVLDFILVATGVLGTSTSNQTLMGIPIGVAVGLIAIFIGTLMLIQDFDQAKRGVEMGVPTQYAWASAFGLMVTVIWMYIEILQLLARLRD